MCVCVITQSSGLHGGRAKEEPEYIWVLKTNEATKEQKQQHQLKQHHKQTTTTVTLTPPQLHNKKRKEIGTLFFFFLSCGLQRYNPVGTILAQGSTTAIRTHCRIDIDHILLLSLSAAVHFLADRRHATRVLFCTVRVFLRLALLNYCSCYSLLRLLEDRWD